MYKGKGKYSNLASRIDNLRNLNESFRYDNLNRLTDIELNGSQTGLMTYDNYGRMTSKTMDGQLVFQGASFDGPEGKPHAIKSAQTNEGVFPADVQKITYTSFDKVKHITEGDNRLFYTYGYNRQRIGMEETIGGKQRNKTYVGNCEYIKETTDGVTTEKVLTYLSGPTGVFAVVEKQGEEESLHYILKDHLGSWTTITDAEGNVEQELSFDAWGNLRDADTWTGTGTEAPMFDRGYTGHEHITAFGLINMNGRCYDPLMSSFLSVDEYVQDPTSAQNFNRYAYCLNNPLKYTDPSGWFYLGGGHSSTSMQGPYENTWNISERRTIDPSWAMAFLESWNSFWEGEELKNGGSGGSENEEKNNDGLKAKVYYVGNNIIRIIGKNSSIQGEDYFFPMYFYKNGERLPDKEGYEYFKTMPSDAEMENDFLGKKISNYAGDGLDAFIRYWDGGGDLILTQEEFLDIVDKSIPNGDFKTTTWNGNEVLSRQMTAYETKYANLLGVFTIYYDNDKNPVGLYDYYDFDVFPIRFDNPKRQIKTSLVRAASLFHKGEKCYKITYP